MNRFVHLHVHSYFSMDDAIASPLSLAKQARKLGYDALALTDHENLFGAIKFSKACRASGIKPILGCEINFASVAQRKSTKQGQPHLTVIARTMIGYQNLVALVTHRHLQGAEFSCLDRTILKRHAKGLVGLSGCSKGEISQALKAGDYEKAASLADFMLEIFGPGNFYLEIQSPSLKGESDLRPLFHKLSSEKQIPLLATNNVHFLESQDAWAHEVHGRLGSRSASTDTSGEMFLKSPAEMLDAFKDLPDSLSAAWELAESCDVDLLGSRTLSLPGLQGNKAQEELRNKSLAGLKDRFGTPLPEHVAKRMEIELSAVSDAGFASYFLIAYEIVLLAQQKNILLGPGRGSAVGSLLAYGLGITALDPLENGLYFERFLNPSRSSPPDIDIDVEHTRRDEIHQLLIRKYGERQVAGIVTFSTLGPRAAIRELGKALEVDALTVDSMAKAVPQGTASIKDLRAKNGPLSQYAKEASDLFRAVEALEGIPRHLSVHASGLVLSDRSLDDVVPLCRSSSGEILTQYDMYDVDEVGLVKVDLLGLLTLTLLKMCQKSIRKSGVSVPDIQKLPRDDKETFELLSRGDTLGVFQMDGVGMRDLARKLKPANLSDIAILVALIRPGPQDQIDPYLRCRHGLEKPVYPHPSLEPVLKETLGQIIYQEQVMAVGHELGGLSLGDGDMLRVAMKSKDGSILDPLRHRFVAGARKNGMKQDKAVELFRTLSNFAQYGFNKSHAVAYGYLAYQCAYLKTHYPVEFMASLLELHSGDLDKTGEYLDECRRMGIRVRPPSVLKSYVNFHPNGKEILFGLKAVKHVGENAAKAVVAARSVEGNEKIKSLYSLLRLADTRRLPRRAVEALVRAGAFDDLGRSRSQLLNNMEDLWKLAEASQRDRRAGQISIFGGKQRTEEEELQELGFRWKDSSDQTVEGELSAEKDLLGAFLSGHPLEAYQDEISQFVSHTSSELAKNFEKGVASMAGVVTNVYSEEGAGKGSGGIRFDLEDRAGAMGIHVWSDVIRKERMGITKGQILFVQGVVDKRGHTMNLVAKRLLPLDEAWQRYSRALVIRMVRRGDDEAFLNQIQAILRSHTGKTPVFFSIPSAHKGQTILHQAPEGVEPSRLLYRNLLEVLDASSVSFLPEIPTSLASSGPDQGVL